MWISGETSIHLWHTVRSRLEGEKEHAHCYHLIAQWYHVTRTWNHPGLTWGQMILYTLPEGHTWQTRQSWLAGFFQRDVYQVAKGIRVNWTFSDVQWEVGNSHAGFILNWIVPLDMLVKIYMLYFYTYISISLYIYMYISLYTSISQAVISECYVYLSSLTNREEVTWVLDYL